MRNSRVEELRATGASVPVSWAKLEQLDVRRRSIGGNEGDLVRVLPGFMRFVVGPSRSKPSALAGPGTDQPRHRIEQLRGLIRQPPPVESRCPPLERSNQPWRQGLAAAEATIATLSKSLPVASIPQGLVFRSRRHQQPQDRPPRARPARLPPPTRPPRPRSARGDLWEQGTQEASFYTKRSRSTSPNSPTPTVPSKRTSWNGASNERSGPDFNQSGSTASSSTRAGQAANLVVELDGGGNHSSRAQLHRDTAKRPHPAYPHGITVHRYD